MSTPYASVGQTCQVLKTWQVFVLTGRT